MSVFKPQYFLLILGCALFIGGCAARKKEPAPVQAASPESRNLTGLSAEQWLNLSLADYTQKNYVESVGAAITAAYLRPNYAEAYNNVGAAYAALHLWDPAIQAAQQALRIKPDYQLARNNLAWAYQQKQLGVR